MRTWLEKMEVVARDNADWRHKESARLISSGLKMPEKLASILGRMDQTDDILFKECDKIRQTMK